MGESGMNSLVVIQQGFNSSSPYLLSYGAYRTFLWQTFEATDAVIEACFHVLLNCVKIY